jgi:hypothetical protein
LERLLAQEHAGDGELRTQLAALEKQLTGDDPPDLQTLRGHVRELRQLVNRKRVC